MNRLSTLLSTVALLAPAVTLPAAAAAPAVNKTWVSSGGTDSGSCPLAAPCKTFAYAMSETNAGGEIEVKDSGAYGAFTIDKSISIVADGVVASVGIGSNNVGITINAADADIVSIRGLTINTHSTLNGKGLEIFNLTHVVIDHDIIQGNYFGIDIENNSFVIISNCLISSNSQAGIYEAAGQYPYLFNNIITGNGYGILGHFFSEGNNIIKYNTHIDYESPSKVSPD